MTIGPCVHGTADPAYARCRDAFASNFADGGELGAACTIFRHGRPVMDVWGGSADKVTGEPWNADTVAPVFSVTKGVASLCVLTQVENGSISLDQTVADLWPEFGVNGKDRITIRQALGHRAGVPAITGPVTLVDFSDPVGMAARLAAETPIFPPDTAHVYHALTVGWITSELMRRVTGQTIGAWFRDHIAGPLDLNTQIGRRVGDRGEIAIIDVPPDHDTPDLDPDSLIARPVGMNGLITPRVSGLAAALNDPAMQAIEQAGANAISDARSLARLYAATMDGCVGTRLLSDTTIADASRVVSEGVQWNGLPGPTWGAGLMVPGGVQPMLGPGSFGHDGMGGSLAFAHPPSGISFAYVRNRAGWPGVVDPLVSRVLDALAEVIAIPSVAL